MEAIQEAMDPEAEVETLVTSESGDVGVLVNVNPEIQMVSVNANERFESLYQQYKGPLYGFIYARIHNHHDAEDIMHQAFQRALEKFSTLENTELFGTWIHSIAKRLILIMMRRGEIVQFTPLHQRSGDGDEQEIFDIKRHVFDQRKAAIFVERMEIAHELISLLPDDLYQVFDEFYFSNLSHEDIHTLHPEIPIGTIKTRLRRARIKLHDLLAEKYPDLAPLINA